MMKTHPEYLQAHPGIVKIRRRWIGAHTMAGVGIDPVVERIPEELRLAYPSDADAMTAFNQRIIDATADYVVDYKVNSNFFQGELGRRALSDTFNYLKKQYPEVLRVCDGKFADVGHTSEIIADEVFGNLDADAVLVNPYLGSDAIKPFTDWRDKLTIVCVNTSNPSASEIQDLTLKDGTPLWKRTLQIAMNDWNSNGNILPVLSATHPENLVGIRDIVGDTPILLAGIGSQGGDLATAKQVIDSEGYGVMISASRAILYADRQSEESFADAATRSIISLRDDINRAVSQ